MVDTVIANKKTKKKTGLAYKLMYGANCFYDRIFRAIFITLLFALDFMLFVYSINGRLWEAGVLNQAVVWILGGMFCFSVVLMLLLSFSSLAQNIFCALFTLLMTLIFFNQFALFDVNTFIEEWLRNHASALTFIGIIPSSFLVGLFLGGIVFFVFCYTIPIFLLCLALLFSLVSGIVQMEFRQELPKTEYVVVKDFNQAGAGQKDSGLIYFMLPKFPSYHFLSTIKDVNFRELRDLMIGFYAVNDFEIYPNAFVQKNDTVSNIVDIYNQVDYTSTSSGIRGYAEILNDWNFVHGTLNVYGLEDNLLYQLLKKEGYNISTYPMPEFNFCYAKDTMNTDRCVVKAQKTTSLYDSKASLEKNIYALLGEWILSINNKDLQSMAKMFIDMSSLKGMKVISQNRRISQEGSAALFTKVSEDFSKDKAGIVYMAYVDLPSDIYIYDEFCRIKPRKDWVALKDHMLVRGGIDAKRKAYADQAKCLIGMMQMFMEDFLQDAKSAKTDVIVQGVSTIKDFAGMTAGQYGNFVSDKLVSMGVRKASSPEFLVNTNVCLASDISKSMISGKEYCYTVENMRMSTDEAYNLQQNLINNAVIRGGKITNIAANYRDWYEEFKNNSPFYQARRKKAIEERVKQELQMENEARRAYLNGTRSEPVITTEAKPVVLPPVVQKELVQPASEIENTSEAVSEVIEKSELQAEVLPTNGNDAAAQATEAMQEEKAGDNIVKDELALPAETQAAVQSVEDTKALSDEASVQSGGNGSIDEAVRETFSDSDLEENVGSTVNEKGLDEQMEGMSTHENVSSVDMNETEQSAETIDAALDNASAQEAADSGVQEKDVSEDVDVQKQVGSHYEEEKEADADVAAEADTPAVEEVVEVATEEPAVEEPVEVETGATVEADTSAVEEVVEVATEEPAVEEPVAVETGATVEADTPAVEEVVEAEADVAVEEAAKVEVVRQDVEENTFATETDFEKSFE